MTHFEDHAPHVAASVIVLTVASLIVLPMRVYVRITRKVWGIDDWSMVVAAVPCFALSAICLAGSFEGVGVHEARLNDQEKVRGLKYFFLFEVFWCLSVIPTKLAISLMLARIAGPKRGYVYSLYAISGVLTIINTIALFYIIFRCSPVSYAWDTSTPDGHCEPAVTLGNIYYAATAVNILFDWYCALLPIPLLWTLQMNTSAKLTVAALLSLGVLASLSACIRLKYTVALNSATDYLYSVAEILIWGYAEVAIGFCVACLATLRPLFKSLLDLRFGTTRPDGGEAPNAKALELPIRSQGQGSQRPVDKKGPIISTSEEYLVLPGREHGIYVSRGVVQSSTES